MAKPKDRERYYLKRAVSLARRYKGLTHPNPTVGAVVVKQDKIVGEAAHRGVGKHHAERLAIQQAGVRAKGAELFLTLEPCKHKGRTPPCTEVIIKAGIKRVVILTRDPHPQAGGGADVLRKEGIEVVFRFDLPEAKEAARLNSPFFKHVQEQRPYVTAKWAVTTDGVMAVPGKSIWWTGKKAKGLVHRLRKHADAVMVGLGTILQDNPRLDCRASYPKRHPLKVVLDTRLWTPPISQLFDYGGDVLIFHNCDEDTHNRRRLFEQGAYMRKVPFSRYGGLSLRTVMGHLYRMNILHVLVEAGPRLQSSMMKRGLVDELLVIISPRVAGNGLAPLQFMERDKPLGLHLDGSVKLGNDRMLRYLIGADRTSGLFPWEEPALSADGSRTE